MRCLCDVHRGDALRMSSSRSSTWSPALSGCTGEIASICTLVVVGIPVRVKGRKSRMFDFLAIEVERFVGVEAMLRVRVRTIWKPFPTGIVIPCTRIDVKTRK